MSSATVETPAAAAVKPRNVNIEMGKVYQINLPNGSHLLIEGNTVTLPGETAKAPKAKAEVKAEPNAQLETPAPRRGGRRKAEVPTESAAPAEPKVEAPKTDKPSLADAGAKGKRSTKAKRWVDQDEFLGYAEYLCHGEAGDEWKEVAILDKGKGARPGLMVAFVVWVPEKTKGDRTIAAHYAVSPDAPRFWVSQNPEKNQGKLRNVTLYS